VDFETLAELEREVGKLRVDLGRLRRLGHDTSVDDALLVQLELLLATVRSEKTTGRSSGG
jgi:hypothetical protein